MRWKKTHSKDAHAKHKPWGYEQTIAKINKITDEYWRTFFLASYGTGARQEEIIKIKTQDIKIEENLMTIRLNTAKMRLQAFAIRELPINPSYSIVELTCYEAIKAWVERTNKLEKEYLFLREDIKKATNLRYIRRFTQKHLGVNHHHLRHCRLTHCASIFNFNEYKLMQYAGWTHPEYAKWYVRLNFDDLKKSMGVN